MTRCVGSLRITLPILSFLLSFSYFHWGKHIWTTWFCLYYNWLVWGQAQDPLWSVACFPKVSVILEAQSLVGLLRNGGISLKHVTGITFHHRDWRERNWFQQKGKNKMQAWRKQFPEHLCGFPSFYPHNKSPFCSLWAGISCNCNQKTLT